MGRQHTIYLSDKTYEQMEHLRKHDESMSNVIRTAIEIAFMNLDNYDLVQYLQKKIAALQRRHDSVIGNLCKQCQKKFYDEGLIY